MSTSSGAGRALQGLLFRHLLAYPRARQRGQQQSQQSRQLTILSASASTSKRQRPSTRCPTPALRARTFAHVASIEEAIEEQAAPNSDAVGQEVNPIECKVTPSLVEQPGGESAEGSVDGTVEPDDASGSDIPTLKISPSTYPPVSSNSHDLPYSYVNRTTSSQRPGDSGRKPLYTANHSPGKPTRTSEQDKQDLRLRISKLPVSLTPETYPSFLVSLVNIHATYPALFREFSHLIPHLPSNHLSLVTSNDSLLRLLISHTKNTNNSHLTSSRSYNVLLEFAYRLSNLKSVRELLDTMETERIRWSTKTAQIIYKGNNLRSGTVIPASPERRISQYLADSHLAKSRSPSEKRWDLRNRRPGGLTSKSSLTGVVRGSDENQVERNNLKAHGIVNESASLGDVKSQEVVLAGGKWASLKTRHVPKGSKELSSRVAKVEDSNGTAQDASCAAVKFLLRHCDYQPGETESTKPGIVIPPALNAASYEIHEVNPDTTESTEPGISISSVVIATPKPNYERPRATLQQPPPPKVIMSYLRNYALNPIFKLTPSVFVQMLRYVLAMSNIRPSLSISLRALMNLEKSTSSDPTSQVSSSSSSPSQSQARALLRLYLHPSLSRSGTPLDLIQEYTSVLSEEYPESLANNLPNGQILTAALQALKSRSRRASLARSLIEYYTSHGLEKYINLSHWSYVFHYARQTTAESVSQWALTQSEVYEVSQLYFDDSNEFGENTKLLGMIDAEAIRIRRRGKESIRYWRTKNSLQRYLRRTENASQEETKETTTTTTTQPEDGKL